MFLSLKEASGLSMAILGKYMEPGNQFPCAHPFQQNVESHGGEIENESQRGLTRGNETSYHSIATVTKNEDQSLRIAQLEKESQQKEVSSSEQHGYEFYDDDDLDTTYLSDESIKYIMTTVCWIDIVLSFVAIVISTSIIAVVFYGPDMLLDLGWAYQYSLMMVSTSLFFISMVMRLWCILYFCYGYPIRTFEITNANEVKSCSCNNAWSNATCCCCYCCHCFHKNKTSELINTKLHFSDVYRCFGKSNYLGKDELNLSQSECDSDQTQTETQCLDNSLSALDTSTGTSHDVELADYSSTERESQEKENFLLQNISGKINIVGDKNLRFYTLILYFLLFLTALSYNLYFLGEFIGREFTMNDAISADYSDCDAMVSNNIGCALPFPSMTWLKRDASTVTGYRVNIGDRTLPYIKRGVHIDPSFFNEGYDGFSVTGAVLFHVDGLSTSSSVSNDIDKSYESVDKTLYWNSSTLLIRIDNTTHPSAETIELHQHFIEVDYLEPNPNKRICYMQVARPMEYNSYYVVVVQNFTDSNFDLLPSNDLYSDYLEAYNRYLDNGNRDRYNNSYLSGSSSAIEYMDYTSIVTDERYIRFRDIVFPVLDFHSISLGNIQVMFDFHTGSSSSILRLGSKLKDISQKRMNHERYLNTLNVKNDFTSTRRLEDISSYDSCFTGDESYENTHSDFFYNSTQIRSSNHYIASVPWILKNLQYIDNDFLQILRGSVKEMNRAQDFDFDHESNHNYTSIPIDSENVGVFIQVPCSVATGKMKATALVEWGAGIFGSRIQSQKDSLRLMANRYGWILFSMDFRGWSIHSFPLLARILMHDGGNGIRDVYVNTVQSYLSKIAVGEVLLRHILDRDTQELRLPFLDVNGNGKNEMCWTHHCTSSYGGSQTGDDDYIGSMANNDVWNTTAFPLHYMGGSMGAILGGGYVAAAGIKRSVLAAGGSPFTFILGRSSIFSAFAFLYDLQFYNRIDARIMMSAWQIPFDEAEITGWTNLGNAKEEQMIENKRNGVFSLDGSDVLSTDSPKVNSTLEETSILLQVALGDAVVTTLASHIMARSINSSLLLPSVVDYISGLDNGGKSVSEINSDANKGNQSRILWEMEYLYESTRLPENSAFAESNNVHGCFLDNWMREQHGSNFVSTGKVTNPCGDYGCYYQKETYC